MRISDWSSDVCSSDLRISERHYGDASIQTQNARVSLARLLSRMGRPAEALPLLKIEMPDSLSGQRVDFARGRRLIELANCYRELGKGIQAAQTYDADDAHFRKLGPEPASVVFAINGNRAKDRKSTRLNSSH